MTRDFLGRGWKFPVNVDSITGRIQMSEYEEDIKEAIKIIIKTKKGERVMNPDFGCDIDKYTFENMEITTIYEMKDTILEALIEWEPRIKDIHIDIEPEMNEEGKVNITIQYVVRTTNNMFNLVYPFYMNEGSF